MRLSDPEWLAVLTSLGVALRALVFTLPLSIGLGWLLARKRFVGRTLLDALVHSPLVLPPVVVGYLLLLTSGCKVRSANGWMPLLAYGSCSRRMVLHSLPES